jgi:FKBP-type peptidyl-prolyl cis-trans isomerase
MQKQSVFLTIVSLALINALAVFGYFFIEDRLNPSSPVLTQKASSSQVSVPIAATQDTSLQVQGAQTDANQTNENTLPEPSEFSEYDQYSSAERTLYVDTVVGNGKEAAEGDTIAVIYNGYLTNGQLFDQSLTNEKNEIEPFVLKLGDNTVIKGWEQGLVGMKEGGQRRLVIPPHLGYGEQGAGEGLIPPNAMLVFDVQLAQVQKN